MNRRFFMSQNINKIFFKELTPMQKQIMIPKHIREFQYSPYFDEKIVIKTNKKYIRIEHIRLNIMNSNKNVA